MKFTYCPDCGAKLAQKTIGDEGLMPYCEKCKKPLFAMFSVCAITLVINELGEAALLKQDYISTDYYNLVSGYIKPEESAEQTAYREVSEEIGVSLDSLEYAGSYWFFMKDMLMIGFIGRAKKCELKLSGEVNSAAWVPAEKAIGLVHPEGSVSYTLLQKYLDSKKVIKQ